MLEMETKTDDPFEPENPYAWPNIVQAALELGVLAYTDPKTGEEQWCLPQHLPKGVEAHKPGLNS
jgi:hypothetical protein